MQTFYEAYNILQHLKEDVDYGATYYDRVSGKLFSIKDGKFVEISQDNDQGNGQGQNGQQQNSGDQQGSGNQQGQDSENQQGDQSSSQDGNSGNQAGQSQGQGSKQQGGKGDKGNQPIDFGPPTIGSKGDSDVQELEDLLREIQDLKNKIGTIEDEDYMDDDSSINNISDEILNSTTDLKKKINELKKELENLKKKLKEKGGEEELSQQEEKDIDKKVKKIKEIFDSVEVASDIMRETDRKVQQSRKEKRRGEKEAQEKAKLASMSDEEVINLLKHSLNQTLKSEINEVEEQSWSKINKKAYGAGILKKGTRISEKVNIPSINVYFDRSGSWDAEKSKFGYQAVESIMYLQKKGQVNIRLYYFNTQIMDSDPGYGSGGTRGTPILEHILQTKPDNVLIMTDSDISDCSQTVVVPGAVWLLFKRAISENLRSHIKGRKLTKTFFIK